MKVQLLIAAAAGFALLASPATARSNVTTPAGVCRPLAGDAARYRCRPARSIKRNGATKPGWERVVAMLGTMRLEAGRSARVRSAPDLTIGKEKM